MPLKAYDLAGRTALVTGATDRAQVAEAVDRAVSTFGRLDILAAIAGTMHSSTVLETDDANLGSTPISAGFCTALARPPAR